MLGRTFASLADLIRAGLHKTKQFIALSLDDMGAAWMHPRNFADGMQWQMEVGTTSVALAENWQPAHAYVAGTVVVMPNGNVGRVTANGTSGSSAPTTKGASVADGNGALRWRIVGPLSGGIVLVNTADPSTPLFVAINEQATTTLGAGGSSFVVMGGQSYTPQVEDPRLVQVVVESGTVTIAIQGVG